MLSEEQHEQIMFILGLIRNHEVGECVKAVALDYMERVVQKTFNFADFQADFRQAVADEAPDTFRDT